MVLSAGTVLVLGVIAPYIVSWLTSSTMSVRSKQLVAFAVTIVLSILVSIPMGAFGLVFTAGFAGFIDSFVVALPALFTIQQLVYNIIFRDTELAIDTLMNKGVGKHIPPVDAEEIVETHEDSHIG